MKLLQILLICICFSRLTALENGFFSVRQYFLPGFQDDELDGFTFSPDIAGTKTSTCGGKKIVGGFDVLTSQSISKTIDELPPHDSIRISFKLYQLDSWASNNKFQVSVDGNVQETIKQPVDCILENICGEDTVADNIDAITISLPHTASSFDLEFSSNLTENPDLQSYGISHLLIEVDGECADTSYRVGEIKDCVCNTFLPRDDDQICFDKLGYLGHDNNAIDGECEPVILTYDGKEKQGFKFNVMFKPPFVFDDDCFDINVWFEDKILNEGTGPKDLWSFDGETQTVTWMISLHDFNDVYQCEFIEDGEQYVWICDFSVKIVYWGEIQLEYNAKIKVVLNRISKGILDIDVQKNVVVGACCDNQLQITTDIACCTDSTCSSFVNGDIEIVRKEVKYFKIFIEDAEFQSFYLELVEIELGPFFPVVESLVSEPGMLILGLSSNIAKPDLVLSAIVRLAKTGPDSRRQLTEELTEEQMENRKNFIKVQDQVSVVDHPSDSKGGNNGGGSDNKEKEDPTQFQDSVVYDPVENGSKISTGKIIIIASCGALGLLGVIIGIYAYSKGKQSKIRRKNSKSNLQASGSEVMGDSK